MIRAPWAGGSSEEESRAYLQTRLTVLFKLMFWCFVALVLFLAAAYHRYPDIEPALQRPYVYGAFALGLAILAFLWRGLLVRRALSFEALHALDTFYTIAVNVVIAFCAVCSYDQRQAAYVCLLYSCFAVLTRALVVPSAGQRTAIVTSIGLVPMVIAAIIVAKYSNWPPKDVPPPGFLVGFVQIEIVTVLLSVAGSEIIYGLRQKVTAAQQLGQYTLVRKIGEGGMGVVYLAHHLMLRRPTAVKLLHPDRVGHDNLQRFEREVQHMSQLTHPNTVAVFDYGRSPDGVFYYAMEYLGGVVDLEHLVKQHGRQPAERVRQILIQVCGALQEAHDRKIIHRDIKPANIILCERGAMPDVAKVVDFGLVKEITADTGESTQVILGTPAYVAPEAVTDPSTIGPAADLYALGCVGYFLLTGKRVFDGKTAVEVCLQHATKAPQRPSQAADVHVPRQLEELVMECLAKQPDARPRSAGALADDLGAIGPFDDWDDARARAWWREHAPQERPADRDTPTAITVDLGHHIASSERGGT
jgi:serine/threonine-protein kinase